MTAEETHSNEDEIKIRLEIVGVVMCRNVIETQFLLVSLYLEFQSLLRHG